ncbi:MAG: divalent-cation tolerance protein CutA [Deltaproteobacteria bacterium]|nr:divalent-cation tolerance protein CutA [Deltaproteobacteria bacterium]
MTDCGVVLMTAASRDEAEKIANFLVEERLAACAQIIAPIQSIYWWEDKICREEEIFFMAKTTRSVFPRLVEAVQRMHSYQVPQLVFVPIADGSANYMGWLRGMVDKG